MMTDQRAVYPILAESSSDDNGGYVHDKCGATLMGTTVFHPIHDGPFALSGGGGVWEEVVPYCPVCETKPASAGAPIKEDPADAADRAALRRISSRP